jgi:hypothetical protein
MTVLRYLLNFSLVCRRYAYENSFTHSHITQCVQRSQGTCPTIVELRLLYRYHGRPNENDSIYGIGTSYSTVVSETSRFFKTSRVTRIDV